MSGDVGAREAAPGDAVGRAAAAADTKRDAAAGRGAAPAGAARDEPAPSALAPTASMASSRATGATDARPRREPAPSPSAPTAGTPLLSVVIPTYNHAALLAAALDCLAAQTLPHTAFEVVVADDGSTDTTPAVLAAAATRLPLRVVRLPVNRGRAAARNAALRAARAPLVMFTDSDVLVRPDFLARHLALHRAAGRPVVGRGPVVFVPRPELPARLPLVRSSPAFLDTANASVPRQAVFDAGLFDEGFRAYGWEDVDLGLRLQALGLPRVFAPEAVAFHVQPPPVPETLAAALAREEERARTAVYLLRKHPGWRTRVLVQDTPVQRAVHFMMAAGGLVPAADALRVARWLRARGLTTLAFLVTRGPLNRHYLRALDRYRRVEPAGADDAGR